MDKIGIDEVFAQIHNGSIIKLDVRTYEEYNKGHIQNSVHIPLDELQEKSSGLMSDKNQTIYAYCLSGSRSDIAVAILKKLGYTKVFSMTHGLLQWRAKKYQLVTT